MDFELNEEQSILKNSLERLLGDHYNFENRNSYTKSAEGWSTSMWSHYADLGLLALPFTEDDGGYGGGPVELMIVMEALGRVLALEPYFSTVILGGGFLRHGASQAMRRELVPKIANGSLKLAFAHSERNSRYDLNHVETTSTATQGVNIISGSKSLVLHGDSADHLIVSARHEGNSRDRHGIVLYLVDATAKGVTRRSYSLQDGHRAAEIEFDAVEVPDSARLGKRGEGLALIECVTDEAIAALAGESVGVMSVLQELTLDYLKTRKQFGVPIGTFQVLQHDAVDMFIALEQSRSMALYATMMATSDDPRERGRAMAAAKAEIGHQGRFIGETAVQLHGGIGMTMETPVGHYFKRATMIDIAMGDSAHHLRTLATMGGLF